ncbi:MAG: hypothetical protein IKO78_01380 [Bacilli bacterium]|nr:hypothetical protein [Bacilli bacterium]
MKERIIKYAFISVIFIFLILYFFGGRMYEYRQHEKKVLTEEQIKKFESDVKNGVEIDINDYVFKEKDYSNKIVKINDKISDVIEYGFKKAFNYVLKNINV